MSDAWDDIQALKSKQSSLREKLAQRKKQRQEVVAEVIGGSSSSLPVKSEAQSSDLGTTPCAQSQPTQGTTSTHTAGTDEAKQSEIIKFSSDLLPKVETAVLRELTDLSLNLPVELSVIWQATVKAYESDVPVSVVDNIIQKYSAQALLNLRYELDVKENKQKLFIDSIDHAKLTALLELEIPKDERSQCKRKLDKFDPVADAADVKIPAKQSKKTETSKSDQTIESLLSTQSAKERETKKISEEILTLLSKPTAKEQSLAEKFRSVGGAQVKEFCGFGTREECSRSNTQTTNCDKLHFKKIISIHTDESLGDCSFLNTCFHMDTCKYVHYQIDYPANQQQMQRNKSLGSLNKRDLADGGSVLFPAQWVQCDLRHMNMSILGKFAVIMADPPWDIHMELPYGTMSDDEMRRLSIPVLQDDGYIFLWVTGSRPQPRLFTSILFQPPHMLSLKQN